MVKKEEEEEEEEEEEDEGEDSDLDGTAPIPKSLNYSGQNGLKASL